MKKFDSINVIPFIDIMLVLLAIVLATASFISQGKIEVNVPKSDSKTQITSEDIVQLITINKEGDFFYKDSAVTIEELSTALEKLEKDEKITIKIDAETQFQKFVNVTDLLTKFELKKVSVITNPNSPTNSKASEQPNNTDTKPVSTQ
ncbi:MAG: TonB system transport protein ExbD [Gammaproteobacteria bacterium]|nr:TonB system transport protein ExbD [Gammaproteobacteria bacterium]